MLLITKFNLAYNFSFVNNYFHYSYMNSMNYVIRFDIGEYGSLYISDRTIDAPSNVPGDITYSLFKG